MIAVDFLRKDILGELVEHQTLDSTLDRTGTELGIVAVFGKEFHSGFGDFELDTVGLEHLLYALHLDADDLLDLLLVERSEHHYLVDTVEELRTNLLLQKVEHVLLRLIDNILLLILFLLIEALEVLADDGRAFVGGHDDDGVLEVDEATLVVGQTSIVEHLKKDVEHVRVGLLNLIEKHYAANLPA